MAELLHPSAAAPGAAIGLAHRIGHFFGTADRASASGVMRWPYWAMGLQLSSAIAVPTLPPLFGGDDYPWGHAAADVLWGLDIPSLLVVAVGSLTLSGIAAARLRATLLRGEWRAQVLNRPALVSLTLLLYPCLLAVAAAALLLAMSESPMGFLLPDFAYLGAEWSFKIVFAAECLSAVALILLVFPYLIVKSLLGSASALLYGDTRPE